MVDLTGPLDLDAPEALAFLQGVQGNLLKGHGRDNAVHVFVAFGPDRAAARTWVAEMTRRHLVSGQAQLEQTRRYKAAGGAGAPFTGLMLSATGYAALGVPLALTPDDKFFRAGLKRHNDVGLDPINDPPVTSWEGGFQGSVDALLLLADDDAPRLAASLTDRLAELTKAGFRSHAEHGVKQRFQFDRGELEIEHFGHQDGISNPRMTVQEIAEETAARGAVNWDPGAPLSLVFVQEPGGRQTYGSYFVFRKLEQHVAAFEAAKAELATALGVSPDDAAALIVGRHRDGRPLMPATAPQAGADPNDFNYATDRPGNQAPARTCPYHAHIRRSNPRGDIPAFGGPDLTFERSMRIARRGITYGERPDLQGEPVAPPDHGVGLLFMSAQGRLRQFTIQQSGSDSPDFPFTGAGLEGLTGRTVDGAQPEPQAWPLATAADPVATVQHRLMGFVTLLGGEYFFAPSLPFLTSLAESP